MCSVDYKSWGHRKQIYNGRIREMHPKFSLFKCILMVTQLANHQQYKPSQSVSATATHCGVSLATKCWCPRNTPKTKKEHYSNTEKHHRAAATVMYKKITFLLQGHDGHCVCVLFYGVMNVCTVNNLICGDRCKNSYRCVWSLSLHTHTLSYQLLNIVNCPQNLLA